MNARIYIKGCNWQMLLRKRIRRLYETGWKPDEISSMLNISKNIVGYHLHYIEK